MMLKRTMMLLVPLVLPALSAVGQTPAQPAVAPGPMEPDWVVILDTRYGLRMFEDLANPVATTVEAVPGLFRKAGPGPVIYRPMIALGLETPTRGGWYVPTADGTAPERRPLWSYQHKNTADDLDRDENLPPPLMDGSESEFDPGDQPFGLWVSNDQFDDGGAYTQPSVVKQVNMRLAGQPYKAMIYQVKERVTGRPVPNRYLIGWEYSTNDDFQDVVCEVINVELIPSP